MNSSMGTAAILMIFMVPLEPSSMDILAMVSLFGASTMFTKSYGPRTAYWLITLTPECLQLLIDFFYPFRLLFDGFPSFVGQT